MQDKLLIVSKIKKTISYVDNVLINFPNTEHILKNNIISNFYDLLELVYKANIHKDVFFMKESLVKIRMIEYYIKISLEKKKNFFFRKQHKKWLLSFKLKESSVHKIKIIKII